MNDLRFYDFNFNLIHIQHDISGVHWHLKYNGIGSFEAEFSPQSTNPNLRAWVAMVMNEEEGVCQQSQMSQNIGIITIPKRCFLCSWLIKSQEYLAPSFSR